MLFADALKEQLESTTNLRRRGRKLLELINSRPSRARTRKLARLERHALASLDKKQLAKLNVPAGALFGDDEGLGIDWSQIDWGKILDTLLDILLKLLPFLI